MKTKLFLLSLLLATILPAGAQKIEKANYFRSNPALGGDAVISNLTNEVSGEESYTRFEVITGSSGSYYLNFWLLPVKNADGVFSAFDVWVNGEKAGKIVPAAGNWQSIGLSGRETVALQEGKNTISVESRIPHVPEIEFIRLSRNREKAGIDSLDYDSYLAKAKMGENTAPEITTDPPVKEPEYTAESVPGYDSEQFTLLTRVPVQYSFRTATYFKEGQEVVISSGSAGLHVLEFFHAIHPETFTWADNSQAGAGASPEQTARISISIPETGYYYVKARTYDDNTGNVINVNINGLLFENMPVYYGYREVVYPADGNSYATVTITFDVESYSCLDPVVFIEGSGGNEGKIIAYNDDGEWERLRNLNLRGADSYLLKRYSQPARGFHLTAGSYYPQARCVVLAKAREADVLRALNDFTALTQPSAGFEAGVHPNPVNIASILNIRSQETIKKIEVYDISGRLLQYRNISKLTAQIPVAELNIFKPGIYMLKLIAETGTTTKKLVVK